VILHGLNINQEPTHLLFCVFILAHFTHLCVVRTQCRGNRYVGCSWNDTVLESPVGISTADTVLRLKYDDNKLTYKLKWEKAYT
jgi:hypothetical protein